MTRRSAALVAGALFLAAFAGSSWQNADAQGTVLRSPFVVAVQSARRTGLTRVVACKTPTAPVHDVEGVSYYTDAQHSVADPTKRAQNVAQLKPIRDYLATVTRLVDAAVVGDDAAGTCAWTWFHAWAQANALDGTVNRQGAYEREWTLGGLALSFLKLRDSGVADPAGSPGVVASWLAAVARRVEPAYEGPKANANNHAYWTGLAVAAAGVAADDRALFDWGVAKYKIGVDQITPDGTLPLEMARGERALHYHFYALTPLVMLAELGRANGVDLYGMDGGALHRLVRRLIPAVADPQSFAKPAGAVQDIAAGGRLSVDEIEWIEPYAAHFPSPALDALLARYRPLTDPRLGGDVTMLYTQRAR